MSFSDYPFLYAIAGALATWRLASIIHAEKIAKPIRWLFGVREENDIFIYPDNFFGDLISCFWCVSVWVGIGILFVMMFFPLAVVPFALSAVAIIVELWTNNLVEN